MPRGRKIKWTTTMLDLLKKYYHNTPNAEVADLLGVCYETMRHKVNELGLKKDPDYMERTIRARIKTALVVNAMRGYSTPNHFQKGEHHGKMFTPGHDRSMKRAVIRLDTLQVYPTMSEGARAVGRTCCNIWNSIHLSNRCGGTRWMYLEEYERMNERNKNKPTWMK